MAHTSNGRMLILKFCKQQSLHQLSLGLSSSLWGFKLFWMYMLTCYSDFANHMGILVNCPPVRPPQLFLQRERAAILAEAQTDDLIKEAPKPALDKSGEWQESGGEIQWVANDNNNDSDRQDDAKKKEKDEEDEELDLNKGTTTLLLFFFF